MAEKNTAAATEGTTEKKKRKSFTRKPTELAVVAVVKDEGGNPIPGATLEILAATKDISHAFKLHKTSPGSDMVTFTMSSDKKEAMSSDKKEATAEKAA